MTTIPIYVRVKTSHPLSKEDAMSWYREVKKTLPSGLTTSIQTTDPDGDPDVVYMVHKESKGGHHWYEIPLTRDLTSKEIESITEIFPDYDIETSGEEVENARGPKDAVVMTEDQYNGMCNALSKHQHSRWYDERSKNGWSYGLQLDESNKQHPMMRPWEDLPEQYRNVDYELPHLFMNILAEQGYAVVSRDELNKWLDGKKK